MKPDFAKGELNDESAESDKDSEYSFNANEDSVADDLDENNEEQDCYELTRKHAALKRKHRILLSADVDKPRKNRVPKHTCKSLAVGKKCSVPNDGSNSQSHLSIKKCLVLKIIDN